jgi:hypothetical protein
VPQALYTFRLLDDVYDMKRRGSHRTYPITEFQPYLAHRVMREPADGNSKLNCIRALAMEVYNDGDTELTTIEACIRRLCAATLGPAGRSVQGTFKYIFKEDKSVSEEEYESHIFAAALCTNSVALVEQYIERKRKTQDVSDFIWTGESSLFGSFINIAGMYGEPRVLQCLIDCTSSVAAIKLRAGVFEVAAHRGRADIARFVWFCGGEPTTRFENEISHEVSRLKKWLRRIWDPEVVKVIYELSLACPQIVVLTNEEEDERLAFCAKSGAMELVEDCLRNSGASAGGAWTFPGLSQLQDNKPVTNACIYGHTAVVELLLKHGAHPDNTIAVAASHFRTELVQRLLDIGVKPTGALAKGAKVGSLNMVRLLLEHGVDANETFNYRLSPLVCAINLEHTAMFDLLLEHGAKLQGEDAGDCVRKAKELGLESMLQLLEKKGVDVGAYPQ